MRIFPGIEISGGKCVRTDIHTNEYIDYGSPLDWALQWQDLGAECVHIIDLDAAIKGETENNSIIEKIVKTLKVPVQFGGGIRSWDAVKKCFEDFGVSRLVLGTMALENIDQLAKARSLFGDRIVVSIDANDGKVLTTGRRSITEINASDLALQVHKAGIDSIIYTDTLRIGSQDGPNFERTEEIIKKTWMNVFVSGGITTIDDIIGIRGTGACGAIIGRAIYEKTIDFKEALMLK